MPLLLEKDGYQFYFKKGEPLIPFKKPHVHVRGQGGSIQFYLTGEIKRQESQEGICRHSTIARLQVEKEKITAFLTDQRAISIPTSWLTEKPVSLNQLQNYQIWDGLEIYWPELKEVIGVETFTSGLGACCDYH